MMAGGFLFSKGAFDAESMSCDEIVNWNQALLNERREGGEEPDYKNILLSTEYPFEQCRLAMMLGEHDDYVGFDDLEFLLFMEFRIEWDATGIVMTKPLELTINLAREVWDRTKVGAIQTIAAEEFGTDIEGLRQGKCPIVRPFAIIEEKAYMKCLDAEGRIIALSESHPGDKQEGLRSAREC